MHMYERIFKQITDLIGVGLVGLDRNVEIRLRTTGLLGLDLQSCVRTSGMSYVFPLGLVAFLCRTSGQED